MPDFATQPFAEQIAYFRQKLNLPTQAWDDIQGTAHDHAFVIAGATKAALLEDFRSALDRAISEGRTLREFQGDFNRIVETHGWSHNGKSGWRARIIYETNMRQSYNAGREAQMADPDLRRRKPYAMYLHSGKENFRALHKSWDRLVLPHDDPWWDSHTPQNGWGCGCSKVAVGPDELELLGKAGPDAAPDDGTFEHYDRTTGETVTVPNGIDAGFQFRPGESWLRSQTPTELDGWPDKIAPIPATRDRSPLPPARPFPSARLLPPGQTDESYVRAFLQEFGGDIGDPVVHGDVTGEPLLINEELFKNRRNNAWKVQKRGRERFLPLLSATIQAPDEVWVKLEWHGVFQRYALRRRFIARWTVDGSAASGLAVFDYGKDGWTGITAFAPDLTAAEQEQYLQDVRQGVKVYSRYEDDE